MKNISKKVKILGIISICLWLIGSLLIYNETNGKGIISASAVVIIAGLSFQVLKDRKESSEL